jgi:hypothetical protein
MDSDQVYAQIFSRPLEQIRRIEARVDLDRYESRLDFYVWKEIVASNPFNRLYIEFQAEQAYEDHAG